MSNIAIIPETCTKKNIPFWEIVRLGTEAISAYYLIVDIQKGMGSKYDFKVPYEAFVSWCSFPRINPKIVFNLLEIKAINFKDGLIYCPSTYEKLRKKHTSTIKAGQASGAARRKKTNKQKYGIGISE